MRLTFRSPFGRAVIGLVISVIIAVGVAGLPQSSDVPPTPSTTSSTTTIPGPVATTLAPAAVPVAPTDVTGP